MTSVLNDRLRADVLAVVKMLTAAHHDGQRCLGSTASDILTEMKRRDWRDSDFADFRRGGGGLYRAVDRALQFHRRAGTLVYDRATDWELAR